MQDLTKVYSAPVRVSQPHFYKTEQWVQDAVTFLNQEREEQKASEYDDNMLQVEPYSGVPIQNVIQAMVSLEVSRDELFVNLDPALIPVLTFWNSGNATQPFVDHQYG